MYYPLSGFLFVGLGCYLSYYVIMSATKNLLEADKTLIVYYRVGDSSLKFRRTGSGLWGVAAGWVLVGLVSSGGVLSRAGFWWVLVWCCLRTGFWWVLVGSGGALSRTGFWWVLVGSGGFWWGVVCGLGSCGFWWGVVADWVLVGSGEFWWGVVRWYGPRPPHQNP